MKEQIYEDLIAEFELLFKKQFEEVKKILMQRLLDENSELKAYPIIDNLYDHFNHVFPDKITKRDRKRSTIVVRYYFFYLVKKIYKTTYTLTEIGAYKQLHRFDHTTVMWGIESVKRLLSCNDPLILQIHDKWRKYNKETFNLDI